MMSTLATFHVNSLEDRVRSRHLPGRLAVGAALLAAAMAAMAAAAAPVYRLTQITGAPGQNGCRVEALNDLGQAVGSCDAEGFIWSPLEGSLAVRDPNGADVSLFPHAINNLGQVTGSSVGSDGMSGPGFVGSPATGFTYFGAGDQIWYPNALNENGVVAGQSMDRYNPKMVWRAFRWSAGTGVALVRPYAGMRTMVYDINASSQLAGTTENLPSAPLQAVRFESGSGLVRLVDQPLPSIALALNDAGEVVGSMSNTEVRTQAFLWRPATGAKLIDTRTGVDDSSIARDLNAKRQVVGEMSWRDPHGDEQMTAFYWDKREGMRPLLDLVDPADPLLPRIAALDSTYVRINAGGQVTVNAFGTDGNMLMLLLTPKSAR